MSLFPERVLTLSPTLAAAIGVEEALLLQLLGDWRALQSGEQRDGFCWHQIELVQLQQCTPFWSSEQLQRLVSSLHEKGLLLYRGGRIGSDNLFTFAFNEASGNPRPAALVSAPAPLTTGSATNPAPAKTIDNSWQPSEDALRQLGQLGVSREFSLTQLPQFTAYWRDRNVSRHSWESKFIKEVWRQWQQQMSTDQRRAAEQPMANSWRPSADALRILIEQGGINSNFIEDAIPEFVLYWRDRGERSSTWDSKFISHIRHQWQHYCGLIQNDHAPRVISADWQPNPAVYDLLEMANIERRFAERLIAEFVLYWRENGKPQSSWSSKFLQFVKRQWARDNSATVDKSHGQNHNQPSTRLRNRSFVEDLTDRSWAS
ncbi:DnaT-like ssDNA-binding domain-containing protein [Porticoccaceae bacterium]|nr:DnaT-like ssDNA-binding domain-containing protein [Porticoccaceae bacterium]